MRSPEGVTDHLASGVLTGVTMLLEVDRKQLGVLSVPSKRERATCNRAWAASRAMRVTERVYDDQWLALDAHWVVNATGTGSRSGLSKPGV